MRTLLGILCVLSLLTLAACAQPPARAVEPPPRDGQFDYQLGGAYALEPGAAVIVRDARDEPAPGAYNICYVNGFQTQPGESARWAMEHDELLLHARDGSLVVDPNWPDEYILDPSSESARRAIIELLGPVIRGCAEKGFDAVDLDNLDIASRFTDAESGRVEPGDVLALARMYVRIAHDDGLAIGQKNAAEMAEQGRQDIGFDFAVTEGCAAYDECAAYRDSYGEHVLQIEYTDNMPSTFAAVCESAERAPLTILRDRALAVDGAAGYAYEQCSNGP